MAEENEVNQSHASAGRDMAGRDINKFKIDLLRNEKVKELVRRLDQEIVEQQTRVDWIDSLQFFEEPYAPDGVIGLEAKLKFGGRQEKIPMALRHKELFVKFLSKYSLYASAQELLAMCLHQVHQDFEAHVHPVCGEADLSEVDKIIIDHVVKRVMEEYGFGTFALDHGLVLGMTYWLAERCYVRWHKCRN